MCSLSGHHGLHKDILLIGDLLWLLFKGSSGDFFPLPVFGERGVPLVLAAGQSGKLCADGTTVCQRRKDVLLAARCNALQVQNAINTAKAAMGPVPAVPAKGPTVSPATAGGG